MNYTTPKGSTRRILPGLALGLTMGLCLSTSLHAGSTAVKEVAPPPAKEEAEGCFIDPIWDLATIVDDKDAPFLQYFGFNGRYQGQYYWVDADDEGEDDDWENRRSRVGFEATFLKDFELYTSFNLNFDEGDFFDDIDEAYITWKPADEFKLSVGKLKPAITQEYRTSSRYILTFERSQIVNQVIPEKLWGALISGKSNGFLYEAGVFSGTYDEDFATPAFDDGGVATMLSLGYDFKDAGLVRGDWFYQDGDEGNTEVKDFENVFSLSYENNFLDDKLGLVVNGIYGAGQGSDRGDVWGIVVMPSYFITDNVQAVVRYTYSDSDSDDGLSLQSRYERRVDDLISSRVGQYQSIYGGVNYYLCGHRLKLMAGVEYAMGDRSDEEDFESVTAMAGVRLFFGKGKKTVP